MSDANDMPLYGRTRAFVDRSRGREKSVHGVRLTHPSEEKSSGCLSKEANAGPQHPSSPGLSPEQFERFQKLQGLAITYQKQGQYEQAESVYQELLGFQGRMSGDQQAEIATCLNNLGRLYHDQGKYAQAKPLYRQSLALVEEVFGADHPKTARRLSNLAELSLAVGDFGETNRLLERMAAVVQDSSGPGASKIRRKMRKLSALLREKIFLAETQNPRV